MEIALFVIAALMTFGTLAVITSIGKPRKPITPGTAAVITIFNAVYITITVLAALKFGHPS